jgi:hypothetical protein
MWYQHNGCPTHNVTVTRTVLNRVYSGHWIHHDGPRTLSTHSPGLTALDLFSWETLKCTAYRGVPAAPENI